MESARVYKEAYNQVVKLLGDCTASKVTIDFDKLDGETKSRLKTAIHKTLSERKSEIWSTIQTSQI